MEPRKERAGRDQPGPVSLFTGELNGEQYEELLRRAENDPELAAELDLVADLAAAAGRDEASLPAPVARPLVGGRLLAAAGVLLSAAILLVILNRPLTEAPIGAGGTLAPPVFQPTSQRDSGTVLVRAFAAAMVPYQEGRYKQAAASLETFLLEHPEHRPGRFYRAVCLEQVGSTEQAAAVYRSLGGAGSDFLAEHALWRLAHLLKAGGNDDRSLEVLADLKARGGAFAPNAGQLLDEVSGK